jgi:hypothetical protein
MKQRFDAFISHASEDRAKVAVPLSAALQTLGVQVWLDAAELQLGDSLRRKIDEGLSRSLFGVVILSPSFFAKEWPRRELDGLFARETTLGAKAILPVLHNISVETLAQQSPTLADRLGICTSLGIDAVAQAIRDVVDRSRERPAG